jgi:hypothetical protein
MNRNADKITDKKSETLESKAPELREILEGLKYLSIEADRKNIVTAGNIIRAAMSDIKCWATQGNQTQEFLDPLQNILIDANVWAAIDFLSKFSAINDSELREDILEKIESLRLNYETSSSYTKRH